MRLRTPRSPLLLLLLAAALAAGCGEPTSAEPVAVESDAFALTAAECVGAAENRKVTFCHATSSVTNPYTVITVSTNA